MAGGIQNWTFFSTEGQPNGLLTEIGTIAEILDKKLVKALTEDILSLLQEVCKCLRLV